MDIAREELTAIKSQLLELQAQLGIRKSNTDQFLKDMDINDVRVPYVFKEWPKALFRKQNPIVKGQVDHPGYDTCVVEDQDDYNVKMAENGQKTIDDGAWHELKPSFSPSDAQRMMAEQIAKKTEAQSAEIARLRALLAKSGLSDDGGSLHEADHGSQRTERSRASVGTSTARG